MPLRLERKYHRRRTQAAQWDFAVGVPTFLLEEERGRRPLRWAIVAALVLHALLLIVRVPLLEREPFQPAQGRRAFVLRQVRFQEPAAPPKAARSLPPKQARKIPIPDPTPDLPEPIVRETAEAPEVSDEMLDVEVGPLLPATGPPGLGQGIGEGAPGIAQMGENVVPPQKVVAPQPRYTETARQARIEGVVILRGVIDRQGNVTRLELVKGLPEGLSESALETVRQWRFRPASRDGVPVPVYYVFTIHFSLQ